MASLPHDSKILRDELDELQRQQREARQEELFGGLTDSERDDYDRRHERIGTLTRLLFKIP